MFQRILIAGIIIGLLAIFSVSKEAQFVLGGVALFFLGMMLLEDGMKSFAGGTLEVILKKTTSTTPKALATGFFTTALVQSSSLVSLIAISFLSAELITLAAGIGIIFGANIGTTATAWLVSFFGLKLKISSYALAMAAIGIVFNFTKSQASKGIGNILIGLALLLLAIGFMKEGFESIKDSIDLSVYAVGGLKGLVIFTGIGIFATVVMQSSSATMALILTALATGQITYENSLALAIGANIGTTVTAILGSITSNASGKRLAVAHLVFNIVTGAIAIIFIHQIAKLVDVGSAFFGFTDLAMKLSLFHTIFNLIGVLVMTPFISIMVKKLETMFIKEADEGKPKYLTDALLQDATSSLTALRSEINHLYENAFEVFAHALNLNRKDIRSERDMKEVVEATKDKMAMNIDELYKENIKGLYDSIIEFSTKAQLNMSAEEIEKMFNLKVATRDIIEALKDMKDLEGNIDKYSLSENEYIKKEYNLLRENLGKLLRKVEKIRNNPKDATLLTKFVMLKKQIEDSDALVNGTVDELIRHGKITASMGTSLMNDSAFAYDIGFKIVEAIEILFIKDDKELSIVYNELLNSDEG